MVSNQWTSYGGGVDESPSVVRRTSALLRALAGFEPNGSTTTVLAEVARMPRPTAHRLLSALSAEDLVERDADSGLWHLGSECFLLGAAATSRHDVTPLARATVRRLAAETGESAFFSVRRGDETVCVLREDGSFPIRSHVLHEGIRFPLGVASAGLAVLALLSERERESYLASADLAAGFGAEHEREPVAERIRATRERGYAVNPGLIVEGSWGLGAAVLDSHDEPRWAISLTGIEARITPRQEELGQLLLRAAHALSTQVARSTRQR